MKNEDNKKHRGEYLNYIVHKKGIKIEALTAAVKVHRTTFYNHIKDANLSLDKLAKYGEFLNHDFYDDYGERPKTAGHHPADTESYEEVKKDRDHWREKYYEIRSLYEELKENTARL